MAFRSDKMIRALLVTAILALVLTLIGWGCVIAGFIIQMKVGLELSDTICIFTLVKHWSLWLYLGFIPIFLGRVLAKGSD